MKNKFTIIGLMGATLLVLSCSTDDLQVENQPTQNGLNTNIESNEFDADGNPINPKDKG